MPSEILARNTLQQQAAQPLLTHDGVIKLPQSPESKAENAVQNFMENLTAPETNRTRLRDIAGLTDIDPLANYRNLPENQQKAQLKADRNKATSLLSQHGSGFADQYAVEFGMSQDAVTDAIKKLAVAEPKTAINMLETYVKTVVEPAKAGNPQPNSPYDPGIQGLANELQINGDSAIVKDKNGNITGRTASVNPDWFKNGAFSAINVDGQPMRRKASVREIQDAVKKHYAGEKISGFEAGILRGLDEVIKLELSRFKNPTDDAAAGAGHTREQSQARPAPAGNSVDNSIQSTEAEQSPVVKEILTTKSDLTQTANHSLQPNLQQQTVDNAAQNKADSSSNASNNGVTTLKDGRTNAPRYSLRQDTTEELTPESFVTAPDGTLDFGEITPEISKAIKRQAGKIRLNPGIDSKSEKYGIVHIESRHKQDIEKTGMTTEEFVYNITRQPDEIRKAEAGALLLVKKITGKDKIARVAIIKMVPSATGDFYRVETAFVGNVDRVIKNSPLLWEKSATTPADADNQLSFAAFPSDKISEERPNGTPEQSNLSKTIPQSQQNTSPQSPHTAASLKSGLSKIFGQGWTNRLFATGKFKIISRADVERMGFNPKAQAFYNPADDSTYFVHDNISQSTDLKKLALHEIGVHALQLGKNSEQFQAILNQINELKGRRIKSKPLQAAIAAAEQAETSAELMNEEIAGYLVEFHPELSISQKIIGFFRNALRNLGLLNGLNEADIIYMAHSALRAAAESLLFPGEQRGGVKGSSPQRLAPNGKPSNLNALQYAQVSE